ncbi:hypothetical protein [Amycolatopsis vastitatis]|uniref:hypothetical protein n=1 Tax=Amycolatopsis vastitatis TaxID=1905142 RepID=UPI00117759E2|nr:hypothetical protein [Amycolatopsis vastitatis]
MNTLPCGHPGRTGSLRLGESEVLLRDGELGGQWSTRPCPVRPVNDGCLAPMPSGWLALTEAGFVRIHGDDQWLVGPVELPEETCEDIRAFPDRPRRGLHTSREWVWDRPIAWLDDTTVAVQGLGVSHDRMLDGIELYDTATGRRTGMFAGPAGPMWGHRGLLHVTTEDGFEVWDPADGARIGFAEGFRPTAHDPATGAFAELRNDQLRIWDPVG